MARDGGTTRAWWAAGLRRRAFLMGASATTIGVGLGIAGRLRPWQGAAGALIDIDFDHRRYGAGSSLHSSESAFLAAVGAVRTGGAIVVGPAIIGSELITNGEFSADIDGWAASSNSPTLSWSSGKLRMTSTAASGSDRFSRAVALTAGKAYKLSVSTLVSAPATTGLICFSAFSTLGGSISLAPGATSYHAGAHADTMYVGGAANAVQVGGYTEWDNISLKEVVPMAGHNHLALSGIVAGSTPAAVASAKVVFQADDNSISNGVVQERNRVRIEYGTDKHLRVIVTTNNSEQARLDLGVVEFNTPFEIRFSSTLNSFKASLNGGVLVSDTSGAHPPVALYRIGRSATGEAWDGTISRLKLYASAMSDADMTDPLKAIAVYGDSTGHGDHGTAGSRWWELLAAGYDPDRSMFNDAVGGQSVTTLRDRLLADTSHRCWTTIIMDRPNTGETASSCIAAIKAATGNLQTDRWLVMPPVDDVPGMPGYPVNTSGPAITAIQQALLSDPFFAGHTLDATAQAAYLTALVDESKRSDGIHFNDAGQAVQAAAVRAFMDAQGW